VPYDRPEPDPREFCSTYESTVTRNLWDAGGAARQDQSRRIRDGSSNESSHFGPAINPWRARGSNSDLVPGGSSGGSAAAVAAHLASQQPAPIPAARSASPPR
jgi:aspartyl-tRNA(Asn)/glutamyl-tRNA(Gln) amidotransferase subunit A